MRAIVIGATFGFGLLAASPTAAFTPRTENRYCTLWKGFKEVTVDVGARALNADTHFVPEVEALEARVRARLAAAGIKVVDDPSRVIWLTLMVVEESPLRDECVAAPPHLELDYVLTLLTAGPPAEWSVRGRLRVSQPAHPVNAPAACVPAATYEESFRGVATSELPTSPVDFGDLEAEALDDFICNWRIGTHAERCNELCISPSR